MSRLLRALLLTPDGAVDLAAIAAADVQCHPCADLADLLGRAAAGSADLALVSPRAAGIDAVALGRLRAFGCRVVGLIAAPDDVDLAQRIGLTDCVAPPVDAAVLRAAATDLVDPRPRLSGHSRSRGRTIAVWGPPGSPGRSTVAALLVLGARSAGATVAVVDGDLAAPQWSLLAPRPAESSGLLVAARRAAAGEHDVSDLLQPLAQDISLLSMAAQPERWTELPPGAAAPVVASVARDADVVIIDMSADIRHAHPAYDAGWAHDSAAFARGLLAAADTAVAVVAAEPLGVHRFASWWPVLRAAADPGLVIANRVGIPRGGRRPQVQLASVLDALGAAVERADVPWNPGAADDLLTAGWLRGRGWRAVPDQLWAAIRRAEDADAGRSGMATA